MIVDPEFAFYVPMDVDPVFGGGARPDEPDAMQVDAVQPAESLAQVDRACAGTSDGGDGEETRADDKNDADEDAADNDNEPDDVAVDLDAVDDVTALEDEDVNMEN